MTHARRLLPALIAALLPFAVFAQDAAAPSAAASAPAPVAAASASGEAPATGAVDPSTRCDKPGANRRLNLVCALGFVKHSEAERAAGHVDAALADIGRADAFEPNDLRFAIAGAGMRLSKDGKGSPERLREAARAMPDDVGVRMLHGEAALASRDWDAAIADGTRVIALRPAAPAAYELRGTARFAKGDVEGTNADVAEALRLAPHAPDALRLRASVTVLSGRYDAALADLALAHRLEPRADDPFLIGGTLFLARDFKASAATLARPSATVGDGTYWLIWRYLALARRDGPAAAAGSLGPGTIAGYTSPWPMPVIDFYLGRMSVEKLLADARAAQASDDQSQVCEAHFYLGEYALLNFQRDEAMNLFRMTLAECPMAFHEYVGAKAELAAAQAQDVATVSASTTTATESTSATH